MKIFFVENAISVIKIGLILFLIIPNVQLDDHDNPHMHLTCMCVAVHWDSSFVGRCRVYVGLTIISTYPIPAPILLFAWVVGG